MRAEKEGKPPPQAQHMRLAVKSSSSIVDIAPFVAAILHMAAVIISQPIIVMLLAPSSVSVHEDLVAHVALVKG